MATASTSSAPVFARAQVLSTPLIASPRTVILNEDGQILVTTRNELNIFTPAHGIQVDKPAEEATGPSVAPAAAALAPSAKGKGKGKGKEKETELDQATSQIPLFRTSIRVDKKNLIDWGSWVSEVQTATGSSLRRAEAHWRCATWSPTGLSSLGGCVLAAVTNNNEALLFAPEKNAYKGTWKESFDLTSHLVKLVITNDDLQPAEGEVQTPLDRRRLTARLYECQATTAAWSSAVEGTYGDYSVLAVGHRSGHVSLWRRYPDGTMGILHRYRMSDSASSVPLLSWSPWRVGVSEGRQFALACLAVADAEGHVWSVEVTQLVTDPHVGFAAAADTAIPDEDPTAVWAIEPLLICDADRRPATQFYWVWRDTNPLLIYSKIGAVNFATLEATDSAIAGNFRLKNASELDLVTKGAWIGASALSPCSAIEYFPESRSIIVALIDGSLHSIVLEPQPAFAADSALMPSSDHLTASLRGAFDQKFYAALKRGDDKYATAKWKEGPRVNGFASLGVDGEMGWIYETVRPDTLSYKPNSSIKTILILAALFGDNDAQDQLARLDAVFDSPLNARICSPLTVLRSLLLYIRGHIADPTFTENLRATLAPVELPALPEPSQHFVGKVEVTASFVDRLFGETMIEQLRCREAIARFMLRLPSLPKAQRHDTLALHTTLARQIAREVTTRLGSLLSSAKPILGGQELAILGRILLASAALLPSAGGTPAGGDEPILPPDALSSAFESAESCPACKSAIPFANIRKAACVQGHQWERCSITLAVISSVQVRTCTACERKALIKLVADEQAMEEDDEGAGATPSSSIDVINALLKAATCCLYCGGRWMRIR